MTESPIILSPAEKKRQEKELLKKKHDFDKALSELMLQKDMAVIPVLKYTNRGVFVTLDFEALTEDARAIMERKIAE